MNFRTFALLLTAALFSIALLAPNASAQRRDYLTEDELEIVRDAQEIDLRVLALTKAIERRIAVINKETPKEKPEWGELPKGTRLELVVDIQRLLEKAISDLDSVASRGRDSIMFPKAVFKLSDSCQKYIPQFKTFIDTSESDKERGSLMTSTDQCNQVIDAASKLPKEVKKN